MVNLIKGNRFKVDYKGYKGTIIFEEPLLSILFRARIELFPFEYFSIIDYFKNKVNPCIYCWDDVFSKGLRSIITVHDYQSIYYFFSGLRGMKIPIKMVEDIQFYA